MNTLRAAFALSPAVKQLKQGCSRLGLDEDTALELVCFLHLTGRFQPGDSEPLCLSPGPQVDKLWQWMLLNTKVAKEVYALIGGEVDHASSDEDDLADDTQVLRRLAALNLLAALGWSPNVHLWQEPHTPLHHIQRINHGPQHVPLYLHSSATNAQRDTLAGLVREASAQLQPADGLWGLVTAGGYTAGGGAAGGRKRRVSAADDVVAGRDNHTAEQVEGACQFAQQPPADITLVFTLKSNQLSMPPQVALPYERDSTIGDLYTAAAQHLSSSRRKRSRQQLEAAGSGLRLFYLGKPLAAKGSSLTQAGLEGGAVVRVLQAGQEVPRSFQMFVKGFTGMTCTLVASSCMLIQEVKLLVQQQEGVPPKQQRLIYAGKELGDGRTLQDYKIGRESTVHLMGRLAGC